MIELEVTGAAGGDVAVGRDEDGRVIFVEGALPGEVVRVELHTEKKRFSKGRLIEVVVASPDRIDPICATARAGCGGCDLAHATLAAQQRIKSEVVADALMRIGRVREPHAITTRSTTAHGYRTTIRAAVVDGVGGYRRRWSHDVVVASECRVAHPAAEDLLANGRWGDSSEVVIRVSEHTGERIAVVDGSIETVHAPSDVTVVSTKEAHSVSLTEVAAGRTWRVSADSFFQSGPTAASALVEAVACAAGATAGLGVVDAYAGIGLFGGTVGAKAAALTSIELSASGCADARVNLTEFSSSPDSVTVVESSVERWLPQPADVVIADPARAGLGPAGVEVLDATGASRFVLVSCDTGSLGRDVGLLIAAGYELNSVEIVDAFPDTSHIEIVVGLAR